MKTASFETFKVNIPETNEETFQIFGNAPGEVKKIIDVMNNKKIITKPETFANMLADSAKQKVKSIE